MNLGRSMPIVVQCNIDENIRIEYETPFVKADETKGAELSKKNIEQERISVKCKPHASSLNRQKHRQVDRQTHRHTDRQTKLKTLPTRIHGW